MNLIPIFKLRLPGQRSGTAKRVVSNCESAELQNISPGNGLRLKEDYEQICYV